MAKHLKLFENHADYAAFIQTEDFIRPNVSHCIAENDVHYNPILPHDYSTDYFTLEALGTGNFSIFIDGAITGTQLPNNENFEYSVDNGTTWETIEPESGQYVSTTPIVLNAGDKVLMRGVNEALSVNAWGGDYVYTGFLFEDDQNQSVSYNVSGNIMSLLYGANFVGQTSILEPEPFVVGTTFPRFRKFFANTNVVSAENLILAATTLGTQCYRDMFYNCTSLVAAPELPATTLATSCYSDMFSGCSSLTTAPELPATTLAVTCYYSMFNDCSSLNYIKCLATDISASSCTIGWVNGVAQTGTFVKAASMTSWTTGADGVPSGWTVEDAS